LFRELSTCGSSRRTWETVIASGLALINDRKALGNEIARQKQLDSPGFPEFRKTTSQGSSLRICLIEGTVGFWI
jgi:hypothetical protein